MPNKWNCVLLFNIIMPRLELFWILISNPKMFMPNTLAIINHSAANQLGVAPGDQITVW